MEKIRLQKYFSDLGIMSRRHCEEEMLAGTIAVNGQTARPGDKIDPERDAVTYRGKPVRSTRKEYTYIMLNKPRGYLSTLSDPEGRRCVTDLLEGVHTRVYPVGRLDRVSEGLLLLTDDGDLTNRLTHPALHSIPKVYRVKVDGHPSDEQLAILRSPLTIDGYRIRPVEVSVQTDEPDAVLHMSLYEGRNRQIRKMCEQAGITIRRLSRVSIGQLKLNGLAVGKWRYLEPDEIEYLRKCTKR